MTNTSSPSPSERFLATLAASGQAYLDSLTAHFGDDLDAALPDDSIAGRVEDFLHYMTNPGPIGERPGSLRDLYVGEGWSLVEPEENLEPYACKPDLHLSFTLVCPPVPSGTHYTPGGQTTRSATAPTPAFRRKASLQASDRVGGLQGAARLDKPIHLPIGKASSWQTS